ncbi:hypothetical protein Tco_1508081 [Tanacetum coccineum]
MSSYNIPHGSTRDSSSSTCSTIQTNQEMQQLCGVADHALTATADVPAVYLQQFWRTMSKVPDTEDMIKFMLDAQQFTYTMYMFKDTLQLPVETPENPFVAPANIHIIKAFINRVGYQGVVDKLFHALLNQTHVDYAALLWWDFMNNVFQKKEAIQYPRFIKLIITDLMKKFLDIPKRLEEDYHSIKDDVLLVSVYTTGNVSVRGMLVLDVFLTTEIRETNDFKEYETVFIKVDVPMNQPQPVVSTQGTHMITPSAHRRSFEAVFGEEIDSFRDEFVRIMAQLEIQLDKEEIHKCDSKNRLTWLKEKFEKYFYRKPKEDFRECDGSVFQSYSGCSIQEFKAWVVCYLKGIEKGIDTRVPHEEVLQIKEKDVNERRKKERHMIELEMLKLESNIGNAQRAKISKKKCKEIRVYKVQSFEKKRMYFYADFRSTFYKGDCFIPFGIKQSFSPPYKPSRSETYVSASVKEIYYVQLGIVNQAELKLQPRAFFSFCTAAYTEVKILPNLLRT